MISDIKTRTRITRNCTVLVTGKDIINLVRQEYKARGEPISIPDNAEVEFHVPGTDWSNTAIDIDPENPVVISLKIRPHIRNHPHLGKAGHGECPACGGKHNHSRGTARTRCLKKQRLHCQDCGHYFYGKSTKI